MAERFTDFQDPNGKRQVMMPRIGVIGLGIKKLSKSGKEYPSETPYFVLDDPSTHIIVDAMIKRGEIDEATATRWRAGTDGPTTLPCMFLSDDNNLIAPRALEAWASGVRKCIGNGQRAYRLEGYGDDAQLVERDCPCEWLDDGKKTCSRIIRLFVLLPHVTVRGCFQISSGSVASMDRIYQDLAYIRSLFGRVDQLISPQSGEPILFLAREAWSSSKDNRTHYAVRVQMRDFNAKAMLDFRRAINKEAPPLPAPNALKALPPAVDPNEQPRAAGNDTYTDGTKAPSLPEDAFGYDEDGDTPEGVVVDMEPGERRTDIPGAPPTDEDYPDSPTNAPTFTAQRDAEGNVDSISIVAAASQAIEHPAYEAAWRSMDLSKDAALRAASNHLHESSEAIITLPDFMAACEACGGRVGR